MKRRSFLAVTGSAGALLQTRGSKAQATAPENPFSGVWRFRFGTPEAITPVSTRRYPPATEGLRALPEVLRCPVTVEGIGSRRGYQVNIPLAPNEGVYGFGLQLQSFAQRGSKKVLRVNADPKMDTGDSHAPVPFYVTTNGYGILIDTARYAVVYSGGKKRRRQPGISDATADGAAVSAGNLPAAYRRMNLGERSEVMIEIPRAEGVDVYVFGGPTMRQAVQRYNLFSGGGALPPRWGLGLWYRTKSDYDQAAVLKLAGEFRDRKLPCDVMGLEPGWLTRAYSTTFVWSKKFPDPRGLVAELGAYNLRLNLWEHAFTHPSSPLYEPLLPYSGDYLVWDGLVPDFLSPEAVRIFGDYHEREQIGLGISGFKLDECDNSDFTGGWSFPELSRFPSGADGEQMHCLFGRRYQDALQTVFERRKTRTYGMVRNAGALAAPYPYALYSDLYDHREFIRGVANMGFSGLLWTPELRNATSTEDLIRRLQSVALSPMAMVNGWYIKNPPWKQVDRNRNNADQLDANWEEVEAKCRAVMELRMRLIPYLHAAFVRYHRAGLPPFRSLVMDYPGDRETWLADQEFLVGDSLLVAPVVAGTAAQPVYLPEGEWFYFWGGQRHSGKRRVAVNAPLEQIPIFVKAGSILPLATPTLHTEDPASWQLTAQVYGDSAAATVLYEDDGRWDPSLNEVTLQWNAQTHSGSVRRGGGGAGPEYSVVEWKPIG
ncbi:MAG TPA: glycoside hydrolase family 31 protein [Bryobacteraceae bacterium]|nr:glycoside hydrolase family 31 protein [Bryobacteraceae bacterium]